MQSIQYGPRPERKDVTAQIERRKKEEDEKQRRLQQERLQKQLHEVVQSR